MTDTEKEALINNTATIPFRIKIVDSDVMITEDSISNATYEDFRYVDTATICIGQFVARTFSCELKDINKLFEIENKEISIDMGIKIGNTTTWHSLGNFLITKPTNDDVKEKTSFESMDYTKKFNKVFDDTDLTYPCTAQELAQYCCNKCGVELATTNFTNNDFIIENNQYDSDDTYRKVMQDIGKLAYSWIRIGWDNKCYIDFSIDNDDIDQYNKISPDNYYDLSLQKEKFGPVNRVVIGLSNVEGENVYVEDPNSIIQHGVTELQITDNNLTYTPELREQVIEGAKKLFGLEYIPIESTTTGHPWLLGNKRIQYKGLDNKLYITYPWDRTISYNGHIKSKLSSKADTKVETEYKNEVGVASQLKKTRIIVDKQNQVISALAEKIVDISSTVANNNSVTIKNAANTQPYNITLTGNIEYPIVNNAQLGTTGILCGMVKSGVTYSRAHKEYSKSYIVGEFKVNSPILKIYKNDELISEYTLPFNHLYKIGAVMDEFQIINSVCKFIQRIGITNNGVKYILKKPREYELGTIDVLLPEGDSKMVFDGLHISVTYLNKNDYTEKFATKVDVTNEIKVASDEILIQSKSEILDNGDALIASINTTSTGNVKIKASDTIALEGTTTVGDKIKFNLDGSVTAQDLRLLDGGRVIGGDGLLTNLQFISVGELDSGFTFVGFKEIDYYSQYGYADCIVDAFIPDNFTITNAYITIYISSEDVFNVENVSVGNGYPKQLKLYKGSGNEITNYYVAPSSGILQHYDPLSGEEIVNAINNQATYTPTTSPGHITTVKTINLKDNLSSGRNVFILRTTLPRPESPQSTNNSTQPYLDTGIGKMVLDILGYMSVKESD